MSDGATEPPFPALRPPAQVMRLARLGAFHQTRLSFLRALLRRIDRERWRFERSVMALDADGYGHAVYTLERSGRAYSLVAFSHALEPSLRTDRVIAEAWDATFVLFDGRPCDADIARLAENAPRQEAGRYRQCDLVLARANRSVRLFDAVIAALAEGRQPDAELVERVGYLMRTTAVYGNGKFGIADRDVYADREEMAGPFRAEMLTVWLIRTFTVDLVEHIARSRGGCRAVRLAPKARRRLGIGNATGLGMAPFLVRHPSLVHRWIEGRETALARVRNRSDCSESEAAAFEALVVKAARQVARWQTDDAVQAPRTARLTQELDGLARACRDVLGHGDHPWDALYLWGERTLSLEGQEFLVSLLLEPHGALVDDLAEQFSVDEASLQRIDGGQSCASLMAVIERDYDWALPIDFATPTANARFWYVSEEKLEPRLGERASEPGAERELPLAIARDVAALYADLSPFGDKPVSELLRFNPDHRATVRRVQGGARLGYTEIRDNLIESGMRAVDILRCKLSFFGCTRFDPRSDKWLRITLYQGAPFPDEIGTGDWDGWIWDEPVPTC